MALKTSLPPNPHFPGTYLQIAANKGKAPRVFSLQPGYSRRAALRAEHLFLNSTQHFHATKLPLGLPWSFIFYYLIARRSAFEKRGETSQAVHPPNTGTTPRGEKK